MDIVLKSKIVSKFTYKCFEISFMHKTNGKEYLQTWSFDVRKKSDIAIWFTSESEQVNYLSISCYYFSIKFKKPHYNYNFLKILKYNFILLLNNFRM